MNKRSLIITIVVVLLVVVGGFFGVRRLTAAQTTATANLQTATLERGTVVAAVNAAGTINVPQSAALTWRVSGTVGEVRVKLGDHVSKGDVLMTLDPASAPASVIQAQSELIAAHAALDELLHPTDLSKANAQKAVLEAQEALVKAQRTLTNTANPLGPGLLTAVSDAQLALETAQANLQLTNVSSDATTHQNAVFATNYARRQYEDAQAKLATYPGAQDLQDAVDRAYTNYQIQLNNQLAIELRMSTDQANKTAAVTKAQDSYNTAVANVSAAQKGPDQSKLALANVNVAVAQANLAVAQQKLEQLSNPDPRDISAAQARVLTAQTTVNSMQLVAPFTGTVIALTSRAGDVVDNAQAALTLADISTFKINVDVAEVDINRITVGQLVNLTADAAPGQAFTGQVSEVAYTGKSQQGVVTFPVTIVITNPDPALKPGMTAAVGIVTDQRADVLLVPNRALRVSGGQRTVTVLFEGQQISVPLTLGLSSDTMTEVVSGAVKEGDTVVVSQSTTTTGNTGGGFLGIFGGGGRVGP